LIRFQKGGLPEGFRGIEPTISPKDEVLSSGVHDSHLEFEGRRNPSKRAILFKNLIGSIITKGTITKRIRL
jgi:hypothetical protein